MVKVGRGVFATTLFDADESRGGSKEIEVWDVYQQRWYRTSRPSPMLMASLPVAERDAVEAHLPEYFAEEAHVRAVVAGEVASS